LKLGPHRRRLGLADKRAARLSAFTSLYPSATQRKYGGVQPRWGPTVRPSSEHTTFWPVSIPANPTLKVGGIRPDSGRTATREDMKQPVNIRFITETGIEVPSISSAQMREVDRIALEETGPNLFQLMENAGSNLALLALQLIGGAWPGRRIVTLAGGGGNGGGGICAARHLANHGADVGLYLAAPERLGEIPSFQRKVFQSTSGAELEARELAKSKPGLIIDALIGYGLRAAPQGPLADAIQWANASGAPILALDVPSGVDADDGDTPGMFIRASWTMTLALPKTGLLPERTGTLFLADIGIPQGTYRRIGLNFVSPFGISGWVGLMPKPNHRA